MVRATAAAIERVEHTAVAPTRSAACAFLLPLVSIVIISTCSIKTLRFYATLLKTSALIHRDMDRFCQVSRSVPCPRVRCEPLASHLSRRGNLFCACSSVQNNTFPLLCCFRFMVHLTFYGGLTTGQLTFNTN